MDLGLAALTAGAEGSATASLAAAVGAVALGALAIGVLRNRWGETPSQEKDRVRAEKRWDLLHGYPRTPRPVRLSRPKKPKAPSGAPEPEPPPLVVYERDPAAAAMGPAAIKAQELEYRRELIETALVDVVQEQKAQGI